MQQKNFYCRSYCLLNMFRAPLCPSSGAREYYTGGCCSSPQTGHTTLSSTPYQQLENQAPNTKGSNHLHNTLELLMMGIMVPETCWASNKTCNKNSSVMSSWHFISTYYRRCTVKTTSNWYLSIFPKPVEKNQVSLKSDKNNGTSHEAARPIYIFYHISLSSSQKDKCCRQTV
jgi:hypothetical protein